MRTMSLKGLEVALDALMQEAAAPSGTLKARFMSTSYTPNAGTHQFWSDISSDAASGFSDITLTSVDVRIDAANGRVEVDYDNLTEASVTGSTDKYVVRLDTGTDSTSPLIVCKDIVEGTLSPLSGTITITINAEGDFAVSAT